MMKRTQLEKKLNDIQTDAKAKIESNPVGAFFIGLVVGVALTWFRAFLIPLILLGAIAAITFWLLAQADEDEAFSDSDTAVPPHPNGSGRPESKSAGASSES